MTKYIEQKCPLCGNPAQYYFVDHQNRKYFSCPKCTYYQISICAERILTEAPQQWRDAYAAKAPKAPDNDHLFVIIVPNGPREPGVIYQALSGEFVRKSELSL